MRRGYTLIEIIMTVAITGILAIGMFKAFEAITVRSEKAKILTTFSIDSQSALDQITTLLYERAPMSLFGCTDTTDCVLLDETTSNKTIIQWYGTESEAYKAGAFSAFIDMNRSIKPVLYSPNTFQSAIENNHTAKWGHWGISDLGLVFAGHLDTGTGGGPYPIESITDNHITLPATTTVSKIYEKYYLVDSAYAVTRKAEITAMGGCTNVDSSIDENALILFYDYRPWKTIPENFCDDAKVAILDTNVTAFSAHYINGTVRLGIEKNRLLRGSPNPIRVSKQKVVL